VQRRSRRWHVDCWQYQQRMEFWGRTQLKKKHTSGWNAHSLRQHRRAIPHTRKLTCEAETNSRTWGLGPTKYRYCLARVQPTYAKRVSSSKFAGRRLPCDCAQVCVCMCVRDCARTCIFYYTKHSLSFRYHTRSLQLKPKRTHACTHAHKET